MESKSRKKIIIKNISWFLEVGVFVLALVMLCMGYYLYKFTTSIEIGKWLNAIATSLILIVIIISVTHIVIKVVNIIKKGAYSLKNYDGPNSELFLAIDKYKIIDGSQQYLSLCIKKINDFYEDELIKHFIIHKDLNFFYCRKRYLERHSNSYNDLLGILRNALLSFASVFFSNIMNNNEIWRDGIVNLVMLVLIVSFVIVIPYLKVFFGEDELREIDLYELRKVDICIEQIQTALIDEAKCSIEEMAYETKCNIYEEALRNNRKKEMKKILEWVLVPNNISSELDIKPLKIIIKSGSKEITVYFILEKTRYIKYIDRKGCIEWNEIKGCLISKDYISCFEYIEKNFREKIICHNE